MSKLLSTIPRVKRLALICFIWILAFALSPVDTVKETPALIRGDSPLNASKYEPGDPRRYFETK